MMMVERGNRGEEEQPTPNKGAVMVSLSLCPFLLKYSVVIAEEDEEEEILLFDVNPYSLLHLENLHTDTVSVFFSSLDWPSKELDSSCLTKVDACFHYGW